jgi:hypothetical protein
MFDSVLVVRSMDSGGGAMERDWRCLKQFQLYEEEVPVCVGCKRS